MLLRNLYIVLVSSLIFGSCRYEVAPCPEPMMLKIQVVIDGQVVSRGLITDAMMYVYDKNTGQFVGSMQMKRKHLIDGIPINYPNNNEVEAYFWANTRNSLFLTNNTSNINSSFVELPLNGQGYAPFARDVFYGYVSINQSAQTTTTKSQEGGFFIKAHRVMAGVTITTKGLKSYVGAPLALDSDFRFVIKNLPYRLDFDRQPIGNRVGYIGGVTSKSDTTTMGIKYVMPSDDAVVEIYYKDDVVFSTVGTPISCTAGKTLNLFFNFDNKPSVTINVVITPWDEVHQFITL